MGFDQQKKIKLVEKKSPICKRKKEKSGQRFLNKAKLKNFQINPLQIYCSEKFKKGKHLGGNSEYYFKEILKKQSKNRFFNESPSHIKTRNSMVEWMKSLIEQFKYSRKTFHLSVAYMDAVFSLCNVRNEEFVLICYICVYLAAKMEEKDAKIPFIEVILNQFQNSFNKLEFENCERQVFKLLNFNLNVQNSYTFVNYFLTEGIIQQKDLDNLEISNKFLEDFIELFEEVLMELIDHSLSHYELYGYTSLAVASSVVACSRKIVGLQNYWPPLMENYTGFCWEQIQECASFILSNYIDNNNSINDFLSKIKTLQKMTHKVSKPKKQFLDQRIQEPIFQESNFQLQEVTLQEIESPTRENKEPNRRMTQETNESGEEKQANLIEMRTDFLNLRNYLYNKKANQFQIILIQLKIIMKAFDFSKIRDRKIIEFFQDSRKIQKKIEQRKIKNKRELFQSLKQEIDYSVRFKQKPKLIDRQEVDGNIEQFFKSIVVEIEQRFHKRLLNWVMFMLSFYQGRNDEYFSEIKFQLEKIDHKSQSLERVIELLNLIQFELKMKNGKQQTIKMNGKSMFSNIKVEVLSNEEKENCAPYVIQRNREPKKIFNEKRVLKNITHKFKNYEVSKMSEKLRFQLIPQLTKSVLKFVSFFCFFKIFQKIRQDLFQIYLKRTNRSQTIFLKKDYETTSLEYQIR